MHSMNLSSLPPRRRLMRVAGCGRSVSAVVPKLRLATTASDTNCANTGAWCADTDRVSAQSAAMNSDASAGSGSVTRTEHARDDFATADTTHRVHNGNDDRADSSGASIISGWDSVGPTNAIRNFIHIRRAARPVDVAGADDEAAAAARAGAAGPSRTDAHDASADRATPINASRSRSRSHSPSGSSHSDEDEAPHSEEDDDAPAQRRNQHAAEALVGALASMRSAFDAVRTRITRRPSEAIGECSSCPEGDSDAAPPVHMCSCPRESPDRVVVRANDSNTSVSEDDSDADTGADEDFGGASGAEDEDASGENSDGEEEEEEEEQSSEGENDESKPAGERESASESASDADSTNGDSEDDDSAAMPAATRAAAVPPSENENGADAVDPKPAISVVRGIAKPFVQFVDRNRAALDRTATKVVASALIVALVFVLAGVGINRARMRAAHAYGHHRWSSGPVTSELPRSLAEAAVRWKDGVTTPLGLTNAHIPGCVVQMKRCRNGAVTHKRALEGFLEQQSMLGGFVVSNSTRTASISGCEAAAYRWHERCNNIASERVHARFIDSDRSHTLCVYPPRGVGFDLRKYLEAAGVCSGSKECLDIADCFDHKGWGSERWTRERISNAELSACLPAFGQRLSWFRAGAFQHPSEWRAQTDCESLPAYTLAREAEAARRIAHDGASAADK